MNIQLKSVIHDLPTNSVEATWVEVITPAHDVPESIAPDTEDKDGNVIPGKVTPAHTVPAVEVNVKCHSYHETQMDWLVADLGADLPEYVDLIAAVRAAIAPPTTEELASRLAAAKLTKNQDIKGERDRRKLNGVFVQSKWIHSDIYSRTQWLGMVLMGAGIPAVEWTTMDGTSITTTQILAGQVFLGIALLDATLFAYANSLIEQVNASTDPSSIDITTGWPATYEGAV